jgi:hypothetical protein
VLSGVAFHCPHRAPRFRQRDARRKAWPADAELQRHVSEVDQVMACDDHGVRRGDLTNAQSWAPTARGPLDAPGRDRWASPASTTSTSRSTRHCGDAPGGQRTRFRARDPLVGSAFTYCRASRPKARSAPACPESFGMRPRSSGLTAGRPSQEAGPCGGAAAECGTPPVLRVPHADDGVVDHDLDAAATPLIAVTGPCPDPCVCHVFPSQVRKTS